jgi:hypothetical protein
MLLLKVWSLYCVELWMAPPHKPFREYKYPSAVANELITTENHEGSTRAISSKFRRLLLLERSFSKVTNATTVISHRFKGGMRAKYVLVGVYERPPNELTGTLHYWSAA